VRESSGYDRIYWEGGTFRNQLAAVQKKKEPNTQEGHCSGRNINRAIVSKVVRTTVLDLSNSTGVYLSTRFILGVRVDLTLISAPTDIAIGDGTSGLMVYLAQKPEKP